MENLEIYEKVRHVPNEAKKKIMGGRLKGMTDINPMYRIKTLTEVFGVVGFGWYYEVIKQWNEIGAKDEVVAFCNINLFIKVDNEWSKPIFGTGGASYVSKEARGLYTSDECFKMALTDAISVACKSIGIGADVYWEKDATKYDVKQQQAQPKQQPKKPKISVKTHPKKVNTLLERISKKDPNVTMQAIKKMFELDAETQEVFEKAFKSQNDEINTVETTEIKQAQQKPKLNYKDNPKKVAAIIKKIKEDENLDVKTIKEAFDFDNETLTMIQNAYAEKIGGV